MKRELEHELGGRRHAQVPAGYTAAAVEVLAELVKNLVRVQTQLAHDLSECVPFDLRERQENMFVRQLDVIAATRFLDGAVHDALCCLTYLAWRDIEVVHGPILQARATARPDTVQ